MWWVGIIARNLLPAPIKVQIYQCLHQRLNNYSDRQSPESQHPKTYFEPCFSWRLENQPTSSGKTMQREIMNWSSLVHGLGFPQYKLVYSIRGRLITTLPGPYQMLMTTAGVFTSQELCSGVWKIKRMTNLTKSCYTTTCLVPFILLI